MRCRRLKRLHLWRTFPAIILSFAIQACVASGSVGAPVGPGSAPPMDPPFDAYDVCIRGISPLPIWELKKMEASQEDCFKQTIQVNRLALPPGATTEEPFANSKQCVTNNPPL